MSAKLFFIGALAGAVTGASAVYSVQAAKSEVPSPNHLIAEYYRMENAVLVSPHGLRGRMDAGDSSFVLVDLRSKQEYEAAHIVGAINIPAYSDPNHSAYDEVERIVSGFRRLPNDKEIIVYCYSMACMTGRKIGQMLAEHGIYAKHLAIGWNEWRYAWDTWNHDGEIKVPAGDYVASGAQPGEPKRRQAPSTCGAGDFSC